MILIMQYLDFNLPNFLLWTVMIFFTVYPLVIILCIIRRYKILMESLHIANLLDEKGKTLLKEIFPKKIREELKNSRKIDDKYPYGKPQTDEVARGSGNREYGCRRLREKLPNFSGVSFFRAGNSSNRVNAFHICVYVHRCAVPRYIALQHP